MPICNPSACSTCPVNLDLPSNRTLKRSLYRYHHHAGLTPADISELLQDMQRDACCDIQGLEC